MSLPHKLRLSSLIASIAIIGLASSALAQGGPGGPAGDDGPRRVGPDGAPGPHRFVSRQMSILDTDGNGTVSRAEIAAEHGRLLGAADIDGDGQLSPDEFRRRGTFFIRLGTTTFFDLIDTNGDQQISLDELNQPMERWFARRDENTDGNIDTEEFSAGRPSFGRRHR